MQSYNSDAPQLTMGLHPDKPIVSWKYHLILFIQEMSIYCLKIKFINKGEIQSICYIKGAKFERIENHYIMLPPKSVPFSL